VRGSAARIARTPTTCREARPARTIPPLLRLQRYLLGELLAAFGLVLLILTGVFLTASLLQILQKYPETSMLALLHAVPVFVGLVLPVAVPMAFLMACLLSYGRFSDDNEFLALRMGGLSPRHAVAPAICAAAAVSAFTLALSTDINPSLNSAKKSVLRVQVAQQIGRMRTSVGAGNVRIGDMEMSWSGRRDEWFLDTVITWTTKKQTENSAEPERSTSRATARESTLALTDETPARLAVTLVDGVTSDAGDGGYTEGRAKRQRIYIDLDDERAGRKSTDEMRSSEIYYRLARLEPLLGRQRQSKEWRTWRDFSREYWKRVALGLSPLAFGLLGVPIGLFARRGSWAMLLVIALCLALPVYYPLLLWGENLARMDVLPPSVALNLPNIVLGATGLVLIRRLVTR
jgi:lipopolysaccharide export system permease protein